MLVSEIMNKHVAECTEDLGLEEVYELLRQSDTGFVVVIDSHTHRVPIGVVTEHSICEQIILRGRNPRNLFAGAVMDPRIKSVREGELVESIDVIEGNSVAAVVVTDGNRQVSGTLSCDDLRAARAVKTQRSFAVREIPAFGWVQ